MPLSTQNGLLGGRVKSVTSTLVYTHLWHQCARVCNCAIRSLKSGQIISLVPIESSAPPLETGLRPLWMTPLPRNHEAQAQAPPTSLSLMQNRSQESSAPSLTWKLPQTRLPVASSSVASPRRIRRDGPIRTSQSSASDRSAHTAIRWVKRDARSWHGKRRGVNCTKSFRP